MTLRLTLPQKYLNGTNKEANGDLRMKLIASLCISLPKFFGHGLELSVRLFLKRDQCPKVPVHYMRISWDQFGRL